MSQLPAEQAIQRFKENEERVDIFVNQAGSYTTEGGESVETIPSFIERKDLEIDQRYGAVVNRGDWATSVAYASNDIVRSAEVMYLCRLPHTSGTFSADLSAGKWVVYQGVTKLDLSAPAGPSLLGFGISEAYPDETLGAEVTKRGSANNFHVDEFFKYSRVPSALKPLWIIGDSITEGSNASDWKKDNYASIIRKAVQARFKNRNFGFANFDFVVFESYPSSTRYAHNCVRSGFDDGGYPFHDELFGGTMIKSSIAGDYVEMEFTGKDARVVYVQEPVNGTVLNVTLDGVLVGTIDTKEASKTLISGYSEYGSFSEVVAAASYGKHTIRLTNTENKNATLCGMIYLEDGANPQGKPAVFNVGRSSIALCDIPDGLLTVYGQSSATSIFSLGVNDDLLNKPIETFRGKLHTFLSAVSNAFGVSVVCDFIFSKPPSNAYKTALREIAYEYKMPYLDFGRMWLGASVSNNQFLGFLDSDGVHPTDAGHEFIANTILRTIGLSYDKGSANGYVPTSEKIAPTLLNGWTNLGSGYAACSYSKDTNSVVRIEGLVTNVASKAAYSDLFILPVEFRPAASLVFAVNKNHAFGEIEVLPDGTVQLGSIGTTGGDFISLSGISFKV